MRALLALLFAMGCARPRPFVASPPRAERGAPTRAPASARRSLEALAASSVGGSGSARAQARAFGVELGDARGETDLAGGRESDDIVRRAEVVLFAANVGAMLVTTRCGNIEIVSFLWRDAWYPAHRQRLVADARLGACMQSAARAQSAAVLGDERTELLVAWSAERDDGDSDRVTIFGVFRVDGGGEIVDLTGRIPFGEEDDATGAAREGRWFVDDVLPPPRDVVLEIRPSHPGLDGRAITQIERQVWRMEGARLVRVVRETEAVAPSAAGTSQRLAPPR